MYLLPQIHNLFGRPNRPKHIVYYWKKPYNLFVTSKNETTNFPIHEFKVLQNVFKIKNQDLKCFLNRLFVCLFIWTGTELFH